MDDTVAHSALFSQQVFLASDHAGYAFKTPVKQHLESMGIQSLTDLGVHTADVPSDYPAYAHKLVRAIVPAHAIGVLLCGTGNGMAMVANKYKGIRAALCWTPDIAALARKHNHANVLCLPVRFLSQQEALSIVAAFFQSTPQGERHARRVAHIDPSDP